MKLSKKNIIAILVSSIVFVLGLSVLIIGIVIKNDILLQLTFYVTYNIEDFGGKLILLGIIIMVLDIILTALYIIYLYLLKKSGGNPKFFEKIKGIAKIFTLIGMPVFALGCLGLGVFGVMSFQPGAGSFVFILRNISAVWFAIGALLLIIVVSIDQMLEYSK